MDDPNPYEPPQTDEPQTAAVQHIKRGIGAGLILLLTPVAVFVTFCVSCTATTFTNLVGPDLGEPLGPILAFGPPALALVGMILWAILARRRKLLQATSSSANGLGSRGSKG